MSCSVGAGKYWPPVSVARLLSRSVAFAFGLPTPIVKIGTLSVFAKSITSSPLLVECVSMPSVTRMTALGPDGSIAPVNCATPRFVASRMFDPSPG